MLQLPVPVLVLDNGGLPKSAKWYWHSLRVAQLHEVQATFGDYQTINTLDQVRSAPVPGVVIVPALAGGCISKRQWRPFRGALRRYRSRGGVVVVLGSAFCLAEEGEKARGRNFEGIYTSSGNGTWVPNPISLPDNVERAPGTDGFFVDHVLSQEVDSRVEVLATVSKSDGTHKRPLVIRYADTGTDIPGAMLFLSTWSWVRKKLIENPRSKEAKADRSTIEGVYSALRQANAAAVKDSVAWVLARMGDRTARLEALSGEGERLSRNMGSEKDYQRLLANDFDLCLDVLSWRAMATGDGESARLRSSLARGWTWPEPPHHKQQAAKGRLDLLLLPRDDGPEGDNLAALEDWLKAPDRGPVAWVELEAGGFHAHQMKVFYDANHQLVRPAHDFIVAVDRSRDDAPDVVEFAARAAADGRTFIHVQVPTVFDRLEEHYAPEVHRTLRKRFTSEVIRGLIG